MLKKIALLIISILSIAFIFENIGIQIGDVRVGHQNELALHQIPAIKPSDFFQNYFSRDEIIVLNLWATWCKPCIEEFDELNQIKTKYSNEPIHFLSLAVDKDSMKLAQFLDKTSFDFFDITFTNKVYRRAIINKLDGRPLGKHVFRQVVPVTYIIKDQKTVLRIEGLVDPNQIIRVLDQLNHNNEINKI